MMHPSSDIAWQDFLSPPARIWGTINQCPAVTRNWNEDPPMYSWRKLTWIICLPLLVPVSLRAADRDIKPPDQKARYETRKEHDPEGIGKFYMDREIAQVMGHLAAGWLERPERVQEEQPAKLIDALQLKDGDVVADIGAGSGYFTFRLAKRVGPKGKVLAVDIQPEMLDLIRTKMKSHKMTNVEPILGKVDDPKLPAGSVDLILLVDVYHEFEFPHEMTEAMVRSLKPTGRIVFVEYRKEDPQVYIKLVHKMTEKQVRKEMEPHALEWVKTVETLPTQHIIIFKKKEKPAEKKPQR
jgi:ubiquinone/menaquinone biosynthesis C-methylase UbiE